MYNARLTGSSDVIMNQDAQCTGSGSIQSICHPPMAERNTRVIRYPCENGWAEGIALLPAAFGTGGVEPVSSHLLAACMEEMVQLQRTHSEPGKILAIHWKNGRPRDNALSISFP